MNEIGFRTARTTAIAAVFFVMLMLGVPSYFAPGQQLTTTTNAAAVDVQRDFIIGVSELSVSTLNPNTYTMVGESMLIFPCYSTLLQYDKTMDNIIGDVAEEWSCSPDGLTWSFKLVDNAYFCDPAAPDDTSHRLTASDVEFSFMGLQNEDGSRLHTYFPNIIESFTIINDFEFEITLNGPFATIMESWLGAMILPEYYWAGEDFLNFDNSPPIGSGAFYYATDGLPEAGTAELKKNPTWYGTENHGWQMHCDRWIIKEVLSDDAAWTEVTAGTIDVMMGVNPGMYVANLQAPSSTPNVVGFSQGNGFVYEFNLNQMSDALREDLGGQFLSGENNQLLLDEDVKLAMSLCVDKYGFIDDVLYGLGSYADSLVTPQNPGHYWYPDPDPYDPEMARQTLWDAGWQYYMNGTHIAYGSEDYYAYYPLCKVGGTDPLQFEFVTLSNDVLWTVAAKYIVNTTRLGGFDLDLSIESTNDMNSMWYQADYDVWLWDWVIGVTADPVNTMEIFWSGAIGTDQDVYWVNDTFDEIYYEAQVTMDPVARRDLTDQLQSMAYEMRGCQCVAYREELYAVYIGEWAQESLGDWENDYYMLPDIWPWWLSMSIYPNENNAPDLYSYPTEVEAEVDVAEIFTANALDDDPLTTKEYRWFWGNGEKSDWSTSTSASYTYLEDGIYMADVAVREKDSSMGFEDYFMVSKQFKVTVRDLSNEAPSISAWSCEPAAPDTGTDMWFNATAVDPEGDDIYYVWTFGDGHSEYSQDVRHQFTEDDSYTVTLSVDDQHIGADGSRPVTASALVAVARNHEPTVSVPDVAGIFSKDAHTFTVTSSDADPLDELLYTWFWGDGGVSVTTEPTADYTYNSKGTFTMTVYADDQTGLDGHNATDTGLVSVLSHTVNKLPVPSVLSVTDATPYTGQTVTFSGSATDRDGDALTLTIEFGDGTFAVVEYPVSADNIVRPISADKSYAAAGTYTAYLYVSDQVANVSSGPLSIVVEANDAPIFDEPLEAELGDTGEPMSFSAGVYDPDGDTMSYYWTWGDGTDDVTAGPTATHTYDESGLYQYRLYVNDGFSHNETSFNTAEVNAVPALSALPARTIDAGVEITFTADASDPDLTDVLTFEWDFGDLSPTEYGEEVTHTYAAIGTYTYSVTVTDGFALPTHTLYDEATVTVSDPAVDDPPVVTPLEDLEGTVNEVLTFTVIASDPEDETLTITWDFGDGSDLVVGNDVEHAYTAAITYTFHVWVDDGFTNVTDSADAVISADLPPTADAGEDQTVNEDTTMQFDGSGSDDDVLVVYYDWTIYDSLDAVVDTLVGVDPAYEFAEPGEYTVELVVEDTIGQLSAVDTMTVTVEDITAPDAIALADPMAVDMGGTIDFDASTSSDNYDDDLTYAWSFSDGVSVVTETAATFSHVFTVAGAYPVTLTVTDDAGNEGTDEITITVNDIVAPVANAGAAETVNIGATYTLNGSLSTDNEDIVSWTWTFTDVTAQTLSGETVDYTFDNDGVFVITLTVEDAAGNSDTDTVTITVSDLEAPVADVADIEIYEGETAEFDSVLCSDNVDIVAWEWTFVYDDVTETLTGEVDSFLFEIPGDYEVTLTVSDAAGNTAAVTFLVTVLDDEDPVADAGADITDAVVGTAVEFDGTLSSDAEGAIENWTWYIEELDDSVWGETATYTFDTAGTYTVTLTVTDSFGQTATDSVTVTVTEAAGLSDPPVADAGPDETIEVDDEYTFDGADSSDDVAVVNWTWEFEYVDDEMVTLYGETPVWTFEETGEYLVELTVTDADGQTDSDTVTITVEDPEEPPEDEPTFIEQYGLAIGAVIAIAAIAAIAMLLMRKRKGGKSESGIDGVSTEPEQPSQ